MNYSRGDIVLADLPYSDRTGSKIRPALVVQSDQNNARLHDVILAMVTRTTKRAGGEPTQFFIDLATPEGQQSGLLQSSAVKCEHIVTLHRSFLRRAIGHLPDTAMQQIDNCLRESLDL